MEPVVLHRCKTPTNRLCACGKVARELARRGIEADGRRGPARGRGRRGRGGRVGRGGAGRGMGGDERRVPWLRRERADIEELTGQTVVPVLEIGGEAIC